MHHFFRSTFFDFEAIRILGTAGYGGAELGEFLEAAGQIRENDPDSWHRAWTEQAVKAGNVAQDALSRGHFAAARSAFLRSSNYTRASCYMMIGDHLGLSEPRVGPILRKATDLFQSATRLFEGPVHQLTIPYLHESNGGKQQQLELPGYLFLPPRRSRLLPGGKAPVLVSFIGADSIQEEIYYMFPAAAPELGYAVLTIEGPGQGLTLHDKGVPMRGDWEVVSKAVLDYLVSYGKDHPDMELDVDRVAVAGASLGGYMALRAATDPRVKACVAVDPPYDLYDFATKHAAPTLFGLWERGWVPDSLVNMLISLGTHFSFQMRHEIFSTCRMLGASSPVELLRAMRKFTLRGYLGSVECPVLVTGAADSLYFDVDGNTTAIFRALPLQTHKELWVGSTPGGGSLQAKMGALARCNQQALTFLDRQLGIVRAVSDRER
ncbi:2,6-dihydropseudooxynicotine hydrolase [Madurella mycetomatis]|uniref:2,6-dihydropseudooxynicotine hydrolase n=1 Tax=Madurella mycetomatis TaxID=100816 RepID=A0A175WC02_9PEZI|nr:2,6-dihydropseudooxynicotine hydrolase [Madurella mycetomatis]